MDFVIPGAGFSVGVVIGLTGIGGGSLMTPLLVLVFGVAPATAVGTDLLFAAATKGIGTVVHGWKRSVEWRVVAWLALGSIPAALGTIGLLAAVSATSDTRDSVMTVTLGVMLIATALSLAFKSGLQRLNRAFATRQPSPTAHKVRPFAIALVGIVIGSAVALSSVGAGAIGIAALLFFCPMLNGVRVVGTDIAHAVPLTLVAGLGHASIGNVDWDLLTALLVGSLPGVAVGSFLAGKLPERVIRYSLVAMLLVTGGRMIFR